MANLLIVDASLNKRMATELNRRGRSAVALSELGLANLEDPDVLRALGNRSDDWLLVSGDDAMPWEHADLIEEVGATIATVESDWQRLVRRKNLQIGQEQFKWETVHRWAHTMVDQAPGSVRRYSPVSARPWTPRIRHARKTS